MRASKLMMDYFESLDAKVKYSYDVANKAKKKVLIQINL